MPTILDDNHNVGTILDYEKEINAPLEHKYYLESIAKLDAYIDRLLNSLVKQIYSEPCCQSLINSVEKSMKDNYTFVSGLVRLDILRETKKQKNEPNPELKIPDKLVYDNILKFKQQRNKTLHSDRGHCALVIPDINMDNDSFQREAEQRVLNLIKLGKKCCLDIEKILQDNLEIIDKDKIAEHNAEIMRDSRD